MLDAVGRDRLHPQMRGAQSGYFSVLRGRAHGCAPCAQRQDLAHPEEFEGRPDGAAGDQRHSTLSTSKALAPPGVTTSTCAPFFLPTSARASGEVMEMRPSLAFASGSPTSCQTCFSSVSSSTTVTVAPNFTVSPESLETS